jgi:hypothetical protein
MEIFAVSKSGKKYRLMAMTYGYDGKLIELIIIDKGISQSVPDPENYQIKYVFHSIIPPSK